MTGRQTRPIGLWGWLGRVGFVAVVGTALFLFVDRGDVQHLANVVTILVPAVAIYTLFDDRLLEFVLRSIRVVIERIKAARVTEEAAEPKPRAVAEPVAAARRAGAQGEPAPASRPPPTAPQPQASPQAPVGATWWHWVVAGLAALAAVLLAVIIIERSFNLLLRPPASPEHVALPAALESPGDAPADTPDIPAPEAVPPPAGPQTHEVISGDNCWDIAERCTGDGTRYRELGPPLNDIVIDPKRCPPPRTTVLRLPPDWPAGCAAIR